MADCNSPRMCPHFEGAFRVNSFSTEFSNAVIQPPSAHNHNHEVQLPTLKIAPFDIRIRFAIPYPHPVAVCAGKGTKRARIEPSQLRVAVFKARKYGFSGLGKSRVIR